MKNQEDYKVELENQIKMSLSGGWCGDLETFTEFVRVALTQRQYDIMNEKKRFKPTFEQWEDLKVNSENLITMLERLTEYQENEDFRLMNVFDNA